MNQQNGPELPLSNPKVRGEPLFPLRDFSLYVEQHSLSGSVGSHDHDCTELAIVTGGRGLLIADDYSYSVSVGDVFVSPPGRFHALQDVEDMTVYDMLFDLSSLNIDLKDLSRLPGYQALFTLEPAMRETRGYPNQLRLRTAQLVTCMTLIEQMLREFKEQEKGCRFMLASLLQQLIGYLSRCYTHIESTAVNEVSRLAKVLSFMEENYADDLSVSALASAGGISDRTLRREFRKVLGVSPIEHLTMLRIRKSERLLLNSPFNITETALRCGFADSNYFSRAFRRVNGTSPRDFRRKPSAT
jgi:AraC family transcriptional regulator, L-rhamnose operon regulatory protein RhaS